MVPVIALQNTAREIFKDLDLYGIPVLLAHLSKYPFISWRTASTPTEGSPSRLTSSISNPEQVTEVKKLIAHKDGKTTIVTNIGYLQFYAAGQRVPE